MHVHMHISGLSAERSGCIKYLIYLFLAWLYCAPHP